MVEPERVGSFGCRPQRKLSKLLMLNSSNATSSNKSPKTPKSNNLSASPKTPNKSPAAGAALLSSSSRRTSSVRSSREDDYKEVFRRFDKDKKGKISAVELRSYFGSVGEYISHEDAEAVIAELDTDGDNLIDFLDFMRLMNKEEKEDLKKAFEMFEMEKGSGHITAKSLQRALSRLGEVRTYEECVNMIQVYDTDGKGVLRFHDFQQMMLA